MYSMSTIEFPCELCACPAFFWVRHVGSIQRMRRIRADPRRQISNSKSQIAVPKSFSMPRFVILTHDYPQRHWDFMLEKEAILRTWRLARAPDEAGPTEAAPLADHRLAYLEYEGPVSGNRGSVRRFDRGEYTLVAECGDRLVIALAGAVLRGQAVIERSHPPGSSQFTFTPG